MGECGLGCGEKEGGSGVWKSRDGVGIRREGWMGGGGQKGVGELGSWVKSQGVGAREQMGCDVTPHKAKGTPILKWKTATSYFLS